MPRVRAIPPRVNTCPCARPSRAIGASPGAVSAGALGWGLRDGLALGLRYG